MVNVEGLEIVKDEWGLWECLNVVLDLLLLLGLWCSSNWCSLCLLLLSFGDWLEGLGAELDLTKNVLQGNEVVAGANPGLDVLHGLSEATIENGLETGLEGDGKSKISDCHLVST